MTETGWLASTDPTPMLEFLQDKGSDRKLRLFAIAALRFYLGEQCPNEFGPQSHLLAAAELMADGLLALNANSCYWIDSRDGRTVAFRAITEQTLRGPDSERRKSDWIREIFGSPFQPVAVNSAWLTSTVVALATGIYQDRAFGLMPILADALQDAGCDNDDILNHCRSEGVHVRGCYVIDVLLGKG